MLMTRMAFRAPPGRASHALSLFVCLRRSAHRILFVPGHVVIVCFLTESMCYQQTGPPFGTLEQEIDITTSSNAICNYIQVVLSS